MRDEAAVGSEPYPGLALLLGLRIVLVVVFGWVIGRFIFEKSKNRKHKINCLKTTMKRTTVCLVLYLI